MVFERTENSVQRAVPASQRVRLDDETGETWGAGEGGQLGQGGTVRESPLPRPVVMRSKTAPVFAQIASGKDHAVAITAGGDVYAWGCGTSGQTGLISRTGDRAVNEKVVGAQLVPNFGGVPYAQGMPLGFQGIIKSMSLL